MMEQKENIAAQGKVALTKEEKLARDQRLYRKLFLDEHESLRPEAEAVLDDLMTFSWFGAAAPNDFGAMARAEGRREMMRHILDMVNVMDKVKKRQLIKGVYGDE